MKIVLLDAYAANPGYLSWDGLREFGEVTVYDRRMSWRALATRRSSMSIRSGWMGRRCASAKISSWSVFWPRGIT